MGFSDELRQSSSTLWEKNVNHPFVQGIGSGTLDEERFTHYLAQDYVYLIDYIRFFAMGVAKSEDLQTMRTFSQLVEITVTTEMDIHRSICADFGISPKDLENTRPTPTCAAYTASLLRTAYEGDITDIAAALLPCSWGYYDIAVRLRQQGLPEHKHYRQWIESYSAEEFGDVVQWCKQLLDDRAASLSSERKSRLQKIFDTALTFEYLFWEMAWKQEQPI